MELKVWCDGIQRVVCGVSSSTTCQDVVFALAHATGQTGRFMLLEKWRHNERLLAPSDHPMTVLSKWGEYANDVTFVMKRSDANNINSKPSSNGTSSLSDGHLRDMREYKKSHVSSPSLGSSPSKSSTVTASSSSGTSISSHTHSPNKTSSQSPSKGVTTHSKTFNCSPNEQSPVKSSPVSSAQSTQRPRHPPPYAEAINKSAIISKSSHVIKVHSPSSNVYFNQQQLNEERVNKRPSEPSPSPPAQKQRTSSKEQLLHRDALRLIDMQRETMNSQEKDMMILEQEMGAIEKRLSENENAMRRYSEEIEMAQQIWAEHEAMIVMLEKESLDSELIVLVEEAKRFEEEIANMKIKLSDYEGDIGMCRQKISQLMDQLTDSEVRERKEVEENERVLMEQIKVTIRDKSRDIDCQKCEVQSLTETISQLDTVLHEKRANVDKIMSDLRNANLQGLSLQPVDDLSKLVSQPFSQRSGSTRRIVGSPRELENAVATNKNPHGVWV